MSIFTNTLFTSNKTAIAAALLLSLSACTSGSDDDSDAGDTDGAGGTTDTTETPATDSTTNTPDTGNTTGADNSVALSGPPQFIARRCGVVPSAVTEASESIDNPAEFFVGEPVDGDMESGDFHIWQIALEPGNYHFVIDATTNSFTFGSFVDINVLQLTDENPQGESFAASTDIAFDIREYKFLEITEPQVLTLRVQSDTNPETSYTMGIFGNGTGVPSPSFKNCQTQNSLALETTQSTTLEPIGRRSDILSYQIELEAGSYVLDASSNAESESAVRYQFIAYSGFGENRNADLLSLGSGEGTTLSSSDTYEHPADGNLWLRLRASTRSGDPANVEFTLRRQ